MALFNFHTLLLCSVFFSQVYLLWELHALKQRVASCAQAANDLKQIVVGGTLEAIPAFARTAARGAGPVKEFVVDFKENVKDWWSKDKDK
jgi:hypothetical protein